jgi:HD-GYP domain-containing protein (c-di-GMP phosphodiesterase class II)
VGASLATVGARDQAAVEVAADLVNRLAVVDPDLVEHSFGTARLASLVAQALGFNKAEMVAAYVTGLLHEIGALAVPQEELRDLCWAHATELLHAQLRMRSESVAIVQRHPELADFAPLIEMLYDDVVPVLLAKIVVIADQFDAFLLPSPLRPAIEPRAALDAVGRLVGIKHDAHVFLALRGVVQRELPLPLSRRRGY